jgi:tetratricopeptide (TPR) repeat protein
LLADRAWCYDELGYFDLADADLSAAIKVAPNIPLLYWRRGLFRFDQGDYKSSAEDLLRAIELDPKPDSGYREYGVAQFYLGNCGVASNYFSRFAEAAKTEALRCVSLASCYSMINDYPRALDYSEKAVSLDPNCAVCYFDRGLSKYYQGQLEGALADVSTAIRLSPSDPAFYGLRGILYLERGSYEGASEDFKRQIALSPEDEEGYLGQIAASVLSGKTDRAVAELQHASDGRIWRPQLWLWSRLLGLKTSEDYDEFVLQFSPQSWPHVLTRYYLGQLGAEEVLRYAAHPNLATGRKHLAEAHFYIGALLASKGDTEAANKEFSQTVNSDKLKWLVCILAQRQLETNWFATVRRASSH